MRHIQSLKLNIAATQKYVLFFDGSRYKREV